MPIKIVLHFIIFLKGFRAVLMSLKLPIYTYMRICSLTMKEMQVCILNQLLLGIFICFENFFIIFVDKKS